MASTSQTHPAFPSRPYGSSTLHTSTKLPDRSSGAPLAFGASSHTHNAREAARQDRERQERERAQQAQQQQQAGTSAIGAMAQLTDEQRDEINEAVGHMSHHPRPKSERPYSEGFAKMETMGNSSVSSILTKTHSSTITSSKSLSKPSVSTCPSPNF